MAIATKPACGAFIKICSEHVRPVTKGSANVTVGSQVVADATNSAMSARIQK